MGANQSSAHPSQSPPRSAARPNPLPAPPASTPADYTSIIDGGFLEPVTMTYASSQHEYSRRVVHTLIRGRRLAPFYYGLEDYEPDWDLARIASELQTARELAAARLRQALATATETLSEKQMDLSNAIQGSRRYKEANAAVAQATAHKAFVEQALAGGVVSGAGSGAGASVGAGASTPSASHTGLATRLAPWYLANATECPICFLYYPQNICTTRCCDQPICTECFVQIKRAEPDTTHTETEPAACPYCMEPHFGCTYTAPPPADAAVPFSLPAPGAPAPQTRTRRSKSVAYTEKQVVTVDHIHPDWRAKEDAVRAARERRANRRVIFRQIGDQMIPVGITSSRAGQSSNSTNPQLAAQIASLVENTNIATGSPRRTRRGNSNELSSFFNALSVHHDLDDMMLAEAIRQSLQDSSNATPAASSAPITITPTTNRNSNTRSTDADTF